MNLEQLAPHFIFWNAVFLSLLSAVRNFTLKHYDVYTYSVLLISVLITRQTMTYLVKASHITLQVYNSVSLVVFITLIISVIIARPRPDR